MKKIFSILLLIALIIPMALTFELERHEAAAAEAVVYVRDGGTGDGSTPDAPMGNLLSAYNKLGDAGGRIVFVGGYTITAHFEEPVHTGTVTLCMNYNDVDYRDGSYITTGNDYRRYILNGPTVFENINIKKTSTTSLTGFFIIAQYNRVEFGEGVHCEGFNGSVVNTAVTLLGGCQNGLNPKKVNDGGSHIIVKSGDEILIAGLDRQITSDNDRSSKIEIYGGNIRTVYAGSINGGKGLNSEITIYGGKFIGKIATEQGIRGGTTLDIRGGDFSSCNSITGTGIESEAILSSAVQSSVQPLLTNFKKVTTSEGTQTYKVPQEVFEYASFTASDGTKLPYRVYFPDGYDESKTDYPLFVYFHGNGSRGDDNTSQLGANHAIVSKVLNSGTDCIIIAPQAPKTSAWILDGYYPGGTAFDNTKASNSPYLNAAIELINKTMAEEKVDESRFYIAGGSNGAGACWSIISRNPRSVAGAVILAGTGSTGGASKIAEALKYTPIYTFHGDVDTTLSVNGTREIVSAVKNAGGELMNYVEMPGRTHDIWVDATNHAGLIDWLLSQKRTDTISPLKQALDPDDLSATPSGGGNGADTTPVDTTPVDTAPVDTTIDTTTAPAETTATTSTTATTTPADNSSTIIIIAVAVGVIALVVIIALLSKKKKSE